MKYEEKSIDYDTGEVVTSKPKEKKNEMSFALIKYFNSQCVKHLGTKPVEMKGSYFVALKAVKNLTKPQITELVTEWFASGKENKDLIQITRCFSANNINIYKANHGIL